MFMRESEGIYEFGSKRISVKVDKDKINIRVGGGYLSIDEFLDQYTPLELEKLERKDPLRRFSEKVAV
jgi:CYTH domain-containing protein